MEEFNLQHPSAARRVGVEQRGNKVALVFVCTSKSRADVLYDSLKSSIASGEFKMRLRGLPGARKN